MHRGYIKVWRKMQDWAWYGDLSMIGFFIHILFKANHKTSFFMGREIPRGSFVCGRFALSRELGITIQKLRTTFYKLKSTSDITVESTNKFSIVCIVNYEMYQDKSTNSIHRTATNEQPANNQQTTTSKECKNVRMKELKDESFSAKDTDDLKKTVATVMGWSENSEAVKISTERILHKINTSKKKIVRPIAYAIAMARKLKEEKVHVNP